MAAAARITILAVSAAVGLLAEARYIGTANSAGSFWVDGAGVSNHATVFESSTIETEGTPARLQIANGVRIVIDMRSRARVWQDHLVLEKGRAQLDSGRDYRIEARTMRVSLAKPGARAIVTAGMSGEVEVTALGGAVLVANAEGVAVANVAAGHAVGLRVGQTSTDSALTGCVVAAGGVYTLRDEVSDVTVELRGPQVAKQVGQRVQATGAIVPAQRALAPADQVMQAKAIRPLGTACGAVMAKVAAASGSRARNAQEPPGTSPADGGDAGSAGTGGTAGTAGGASAGAGISTAVIAGVAIAAVAAAVAGVVVAEHHAAPLSAGR